MVIGYGLWVIEFRLKPTKAFSPFLLRPSNGYWLLSLGWRLKMVFCQFFLMIVVYLAKQLILLH